MTLLEAITSTLEPFTTICGRLGLESPTPELRLEMRKLIDAGTVTQVGERRGAKYVMAAGFVPAAAPAPVAVETAADDSAAVPVAVPVEDSKPLGKPAMKPFVPPKPQMGWEWADPETTVFCQWEFTIQPVHEWLIENWATLAQVPGDVLDLGYRITHSPGCSFSGIEVANGITELAQIGRIRARRRLVNGSFAGHVFGAWPDENTAA